MEKKTKAYRVRKYMAENPTSQPREVAQALEKFGITAQYVSLVKHKDRQRTEEGNSSGVEETQPTKQGHGHDAALSKIISAAAFVRECGGVKEAHAAIEAAAQIAKAMQ